MPENTEKTLNTGNASSTGFAVEEDTMKGEAMYANSRAFVNAVTKIKESLKPAVAESRWGADGQNRLSPKGIEKAVRDLIGFKQLLARFQGHWMLREYPVLKREYDAALRSLDEYLVDVRNGRASFVNQWQRPIDDVYTSLLSGRLSNSEYQGFGERRNADGTPIQKGNTAYAEENEVVVKSLNEPGVITGMARQKGGGVVYRVTLKSGGLAVCTADDLEGAGKATVKKELMRREIIGGHNYVLYDNGEVMVSDRDGRVLQPMDIQQNAAVSEQIQKFQSLRNRLLQQPAEIDNSQSINGESYRVVERSKFGVTIENEKTGKQYAVMNVDPQKRKFWTVTWLTEKGRMIPAGNAVIENGKIMPQGAWRSMDDAQKTPNTPKVVDLMNRRMVALAKFVQKRMVSAVPDKFVMSMTRNELFDLKEMWKRVRIGTQGEGIVAQRLDAALDILTQIHIAMPERERKTLASLLSHRLTEAAQVVRGIVIQRSRVASVASTKDDAPAPPWLKTRDAVLHDALNEVQATIKEGQPVAISEVVVTDPEDIRIADARLSVKVGNDWKALTDEETDALCMRFECLSPSMHRSMVKHACMKGESVPADVLADYPDISQQQAEKNSIKSATQLTGKLIKALGLRYKRKALPALLENDVIKQMPDQCAKAARALRNARRSGMLSGETEKALRRMKAQEGCRLIAKIATLSMKQTDLPAFLNTKYAPRSLNAGKEMGK